MNDVPPPRDGRAPARRLLVVVAWTVLCLLVLVWWAAHYSSFVEMAGEWQFASLGRYFPAMTVVLAILVLVLPLAAILTPRRRRDEPPPGQRIALALASLRRGRHFFVAVAVVAALVTIGVLIRAATLPSGGGPVRQIDPRHPLARFDGPARLAPGVRLGRVARIEESVGLARRVLYLAPVEPVSAGGVRLLTQVERLPPPGLRFRRLGSGILVADGVPGEVSNLYHAVGVDVPAGAPLLVRDIATVRWRADVLAVQTGLLTLAAAIAALLFARQERGLRRRVARIGQPL